MILVIGGTGFIGKNLLLTLQAQGLAATTVSRHPDKAFLAKMAPEVQSLTLERFFGDPAAALSGCQAVVYLASGSTPGANLRTPWREASLTVDPLLRLASAVTEYSDAHFILLSSGGTIYGRTQAPLIDETAALSPISPYGVGKKMSEAAVEFLAASKGLTYTILRPSNPIGRWQESRNQGVVGALVRAARDDTAFPMIGDGSAVRDYFDVADLSSAILATLRNREIASGQIWNVGSGQGYSVREMLDLVSDVTQREITIRPLPARSSDVDRVILDASRIKETIGWQATTPLRASISRLWQRQVAMLFKEVMV